MTRKSLHLERKSPGDAIKAEDWNRLVDLLERLETMRVGGGMTKSTRGGVLLLSNQGDIPQANLRYAKLTERMIADGRGAPTRFTWMNQDEEDGGVDLPEGEDEEDPSESGVCYCPLEDGWLESETVVILGKVKKSPLWNVVAIFGCVRPMSELIEA